MIYALSRYRSITELPVSLSFLQITQPFIVDSYTCLKKKTETNSTLEGHFIKKDELKLIHVEFFAFFTLCVLLLMHPNCFT